MAWTPATTYTLGKFTEPQSVLAFMYEATTAGTSGSVEPTWPQTANATVTDGTVVWTARTATTITWTASPLYTAGATEPVWPTLAGLTVTDGTITWTTRTAQIIDEKCPHSKIAIPMASKVYSPYRDVVRYSVTNYPRDWTTPDDAGFLPTGLNAP